MIYNIETLSQSELLRLLINIHNRWGIDAIDANRMNEELDRIESLKRQKQIAKDIANSGYNPEELLEVLTNMVNDKPASETRNKMEEDSPSHIEVMASSSDIQLNIVGKIDLDAINQRSRPVKKVKNYRLKKVATELNVGISTIVDYLAKKGCLVAPNPNARISTEQYENLCIAFNKNKIR